MIPNEPETSLHLSDDDPGEAPPPAPERSTRKPLVLWDRVKFLVLMAVASVLFVWAAMSNNPLLGFTDALRQQARSKRWLLVLGGIEILRQVHYLVSEHWAG